MDDKTIKALHGSVRKWIKIATWKGEDNGIDDCPLCEKFYDDECKACPVSMKTGKSSCVASPYTNWRIATRIYEEFSYRVFDEVSQKAAEQMALFLIDLLPENERARYYE